MMDLTPLDVRKKKDDFRRIVRGYDPAQVESFLDLVADRLERLVQSELRLKEQGELLREQLTAFQERERALNEALVTAQELREEARAQAEKAAGLTVREAQQEAEALTRQAELAVERSQRSLDDLFVRRSGYIRSLRSMLERFLEEVGHEERRLEIEGRPGSQAPEAWPGPEQDGSLQEVGEEEGRHAE